MIIDDNTVQVKSDPWSDSHFSLIIRLDEVCKAAGRRVRDGRDTYTEVPVPRARKLINLIYQYGDEEDKTFTEQYLKTHPNKIIKKETTTA